MYVHTYVRTTGQSVQLTQVWRACALSDMFSFLLQDANDSLKFLQASSHGLCGLECFCIVPKFFAVRTRTKIIRQRSSRNSIINRDTAEGKSYGGNNSSSKQSLHAPRHLTQQCSGRQVGNARASRQMVQSRRCLDL